MTTSPTTTVGAPPAVSIPLGKAVNSHTVAAIVAAPVPTQTIAVTLKAPPETHDYLGDLTSGAVGIVGALLGAFAAYLFQMRAADKARKHELEDRDKSQTFSVLHKLQKIYPAQRKIREHIEEAQARI